MKGEYGSYNAFELPSNSSNNISGGISLASVKNSCHALRHLSRAGPDGYHWRVRVDDKTSNPKSTPKYSWWDIQDEAARLPIKQVGYSELQHLLSGGGSNNSSNSLRGSGSGGDSSGTKGVVRSLGKAMNKVAASVEGAASSASGSTFDGGPRVPILMFKLLDLMKLHDEHKSSHDPPPSRSTSASYRPSTSNVGANRRTNGRANSTSSGASPARTGIPPTGRRSQQQQAPQGQGQTRRAPKQPESLLDFGSGPSTSRPGQSQSAPSSYGSTPTTAAKPTETRAQRLKRQYEQKKKTENRVWDEVDQRWVAVDAASGTPVNRGTTSAPPGVASGPKSATPASGLSQKPKVKAISLDQVNTAGKSAAVAAAVQSRVDEMKTAQEDAVNRIRKQEQDKKTAEAEEDLVRQKLEPKIKAWSEEHGKKKQLRALLASLHTILWDGAKWKQVNLGDLLDDRKCKLAFHKASRVVHPDKTIHLSAEERFLAKRIFDALSQVSLFIYVCMLSTGKKKKREFPFVYHFL